MPQWNAAEGNLYWQGRVVLHLPTQANTERPILDAFEENNWKPVVPNPIPRDSIGDPTQSRRSAIANLNRHLGDDPPLEFFSVRGGRVGWRELE